MPQLQAKTVNSRKVWSSPDGQRVIHEVILDCTGDELRAKTYSNDISQVGWEGTVITEEKPGKMGSETFVKQPQKEFGGYGGKPASPAPNKPSYAPKDDAAIKAMFAIKAAIAYGADKGFEIETIEDAANDFFAMVDRVKGSEANKSDTVKEELDKVFDLDGSQIMDEGEDPWKNPTA